MRVVKISSLMRLKRYAAYSTFIFLLVKKRISSYNPFFYCFAVREYLFGLPRAEALCAAATIWHLREQYFLLGYGVEYSVAQVPHFLVISALRLAADHFVGPLCACATVAHLLLQYLPFHCILGGKYTDPHNSQVRLSLPDEAAHSYEQYT